MCCDFHLDNRCCMCCIDMDSVKPFVHCKIACSIWRFLFCTFWRFWVVPPSMRMHLELWCHERVDDLSSRGKVL